MIMQLQFSQKDKSKMRFEIEFWGYTWEDFFHVIFDKGGVLLTYSGSLDNEGIAQMEELLYIDYAPRLEDIYNSKAFNYMKSEIGEDKKLFYSYTPTKELYGKTIRDALVYELRPRFNILKPCRPNVELYCKGACALFPQHLLA